VETAQPFLALVAACLLAGCGGQTSASPVASTSTPPATQFMTFQSAHFTVRHTSLDASTVAQTAARLEAEYARILEDLSVTQMPNVMVTLYPNIEALRQAVSPIVGALPSFATALVTGVDAVHSLSPNLAATWSYTNGVTAYDDAQTLPYVTAGPLPSFAQLNAFDNTVVYGVGAWMGRFIEETRGWDTYRALIRSNGDVARVLGTTEAGFLNEWAAFVRGFR
jgi:hypothetical protein